MQTYEWHDFAARVDDKHMKSVAQMHVTNILYSAWIEWLTGDLCSDGSGKKK